MLSYIKKVLGDPQERDLKRYMKTVNQINQLEERMSTLSDDELKRKTDHFREQLQNGKTLDDITVEAFAVVREASKRVIGLRHFDVQLVGGLVLQKGNIAEMPTGEGKTLVASLPSYLRALEGKGVHIITVNEYLARRDKELIGQVHEFLGLKVGLNIPQLSPVEKKEAYSSDITYGVGNEFGFDFLRDNMVRDINEKVQRPFHYAIIDEIDSVLVDEAKTPLIIAGKTQVSPNLYYVCAKIAGGFKADKDYIFDPLTKATNLTDDGITKVERAFGIDNLYDLEHQTLYHFIIQALRARVMFRKDVDYIVHNGELQLVDMFTGRIMEGRTYSDGLHQALEAKEGLIISEENKTHAIITIQNYFRMYPILSGMTGTAKTEEKEFQILYGMDVFQVPTNKPQVRLDSLDKVYSTIHEKYIAVREEVKGRFEKGQPVLIGTTSIIQSEEMAKYLDEISLPYELLNAKSVEHEVRLISLAGQKGQVTIATNMAGRGTDIMLGEGVAELGGLFVLGTERHESRRIDNQLKGRSGRQGDPGETQFYISIEDEILQRFGNEEIEKYKTKLKVDSNGLIISDGIDKLINKIQRMCEDTNYAAREFLLKLDDVVNEQRNIMYDIRNKALQTETPLQLVNPMFKSTVEQLLQQHCPEHLLPEEWNIAQLEVQLSHIFIHNEIDFKQSFSEYNDLADLVNIELKKSIDLINKYADDFSVQVKTKNLLLMTLDYHWLKHLEDMTRLKEGIGLRGYSQESPFQVYHREGFQLFQTMYHAFEQDTIFHVINIIRGTMAKEIQEED